MSTTALEPRYPFLDTIILLPRKKGQGRMSTSYRTQGTEGTDQLSRSRRRHLLE